MKDLTDILGSEFLISIAAAMRKAGAPAEFHYLTGNAMLSGEQMDQITLNFDNLYQQAFFELGMWQIIETNDLNGENVPRTFTIYNSDPEKGGQMTINTRDVRDGWVEIKSKNETKKVKLFYVNDDVTKNTPKFLLQLTQGAGVPILHMPHGNTAVGREHTLILDYEERDQNFFDYLIILAMRNDLVSVGLAHEDPDFSPYLRTVLTLLNPNHKSDLSLSSYEQQVRQRIKRVQQEYNAVAFDGRGMTMTINSRLRNMQKAIVNGAGAEASFITDGKALDLLRYVTTIFTPFQERTVDAGQDWQKAIRDWAEDYLKKGNATSQQKRKKDLLFSALLCILKADTSGVFEARAGFKGEKGGARKEQDVTEAELLKVRDSRIALINQAYPDQSDWQYHYLMGQVYRGHYDYRKAYEHFERMLEVLNNYPRAFDKTDYVREMGRAWFASIVFNQVFVEQARLARLDTTLPIPDLNRPNRIKALREELLEGPYLKYKRWSKSATPLQLRVGDRFLAMGQEADNLYSIAVLRFEMLAFHRDNKDSPSIDEQVLINLLWGLSPRGEAKAQRDRFLLPGGRRCAIISIRGNPQKNSNVQSGILLLNTGIQRAEQFVAFNTLERAFSNEGFAVLAKTKINGGDPSNSLGTRVDQLESSLITNRLDEAEEMLREAEQLKGQLFLSDDDPTARKLYAQKAAFLVARAGQRLILGNVDESNRLLDEAIQLTDSQADKYRVLADRTAWITLKQMSYRAKIMKQNYRAIDTADVRAELTDIVRWYEQQPKERKPSNSELMAMYLVMCDLFDLMGAGVYADVSALDKALGMDLKDFVNKVFQSNGLLKQTAARLGMTRPNTFLLQAFDSHLLALSYEKGQEKAFIPAFYRAETFYRAAYQSTNDLEQRARHGLRLAQFYAAVANSPAAPSKIKIQASFEASELMTSVIHELLKVASEKGLRADPLLIVKIGTSKNSDGRYHDSHHAAFAACDPNIFLNTI